MVTHDAELAGRIPRQIEIVNGNIAADRRRPLAARAPQRFGNGLPAGVSARGIPSGIPVLAGGD
jgi:hypothetical protein